MTVGSFAAELRRLVEDVSLPRLATQLGVAERTVRSWLRAERVTSPDMVFALERHLNLPAGTLSRHLGYVPAAEAATEIVHAAVTRRVAESVGDYAAELAADQRLLERVEIERAAQRGLRLELLRVAVEDFEAEHGPLSVEELSQARTEMGLPPS